MAFNWRKFPWTNLHDLNLDWIIQTVKTLENNLADALAQVQTTVDAAITKLLTGSGDLTINKTGDVRISGNSVQLSKTVISAGNEQLTMHNTTSNTSMGANYNSGTLTLTNNQNGAAGVAVYPVNTPADGGGDNSDFAANVGYVKTAVEAVSNALATETENRTSGDAALQSTIDSVIMPRLNKIPTKTSELINDSGFGTYSKPAGGIPESDLSLDVKTKLNNVSAVESVNGRTGAVVLDASDVGAVESVNGRTGAVVLNAEDVGAQRTLIAGSGITIVQSENGDIIQSDASGGSGTVSFVDVAGGAPIASFTLNQTQDCEINVNDLNASLSTKVNNLETSLSNNYRTAAEQDVIDNTKLADAPVDGKEYARKNGNWHEIANAVESVNGKTGVVTLNATEIASTKPAPTNTISFLIAGSFDEALVELKLNGASASANDFISAINSGSAVTVGLNDQGNPKVTFDDRPVKYKITGDTLSLCFIAEIGHQYTPAIYVLSGTTSGTTVSTLVEHNFTDSFYQENYVSANDLPVSAPMTVEEYLEALEARIAALESK